MNRNDLPKIIVIAGTNASGKSSLGIELAKKYNGEIISADSRQIYNGFDLCCGKVTKEEMSIVPHHLIDICNIGDYFSVSDYQKKVYSIIPQIVQRGHIPFIVGGTGLYISSIINGYEFNDETIDLGLRKELETKSLDELKKMLPIDAMTHLKNNNSDANNKRRIIRLLEKIHNGEDLNVCNSPRFNVLQIGVTWPKEILDKRIEERLSLRIKQGMIDEVRQYLESGNSAQYLYDLGLEYRYILWYITGKYSCLEEFFDEMSRAIKKFSKRQITWFKRDKSIYWIDMQNNSFAQASQLIDSFL